MKDRHLPKNVQNELPEKIELFGETLDFSELLIVKGGKDKKKEPATVGNSGFVGCGCHNGQ